MYGVGAVSLKSCLSAMGEGCSIAVVDGIVGVISLL